MTEVWFYYNNNDRSRPLQCNDTPTFHLGTRVTVTLLATSLVAWFCTCSLNSQVLLSTASQSYSISKVLDWSA